MEGEQGFFRRHGLLVRPAKLRRVLSVTSRGLGIGDIERDAPGSPGLVPGAACQELMCDRLSVLGNPFRACERNEQGQSGAAMSAARQAVCHAFAEYCARMLVEEGWIPLSEVVEAVTSALSPSRIACSWSWASGPGGNNCRGFSVALRAAGDLGSRLSLVRRCIPVRCRAQPLEARVELHLCAPPGAAADPRVFRGVSPRRWCLGSSDIRARVRRPQLGHRARHAWLEIGGHLS